MKKIIVASVLLMSGVCWAGPHAYPVPYVAKQHSSVGITFNELPGAGDIKVYTITGEEVVRLSVANGELSKEWNVTNSSGEKLATGVYLFVINAGGQKSNGKLVVIR